MAQQQFLTYYINLPDQALVDELQHTGGQGGAVGATIEAPYNPGPPPGGAAVAYGQMLRDRHPDTYPVPPYMPLRKDTEPMVSPSITSAWFGSEYNFPTNVREFTRKTGGWFGIPFLFGTTVKFYWRGVFNYVPDGSTGPTGEPGGEGDEPAQIPQRRFIDGFELPPTGEGGTSTAGDEISRDASRTVEGYGLSFRGMTNKYKQHTINEYTGSSPTESWERFYVRVRQLDPSQSINIWRCTLTTAPLAGLLLDITATGQLGVWNRSNAGVDSLLATVGTLEVGEWQKIDLLLNFNNGSGTARFRVFINGILEGTFDLGSASGGFGTAGAHSLSYIGNSRSQTNNLEVDIDDWHNAAIPYYDNGVDPPEERLNSVDWINGTHIIAAHASGFGAGHETWAGDWRRLLNKPVAGSEVLCTSSTAEDRMEVTTDAEAAALVLEGSIGPVAMVVARYGNRGGTANGKLGWSINGSEDIDTIVESGAVTYVSRLWCISSVATVPLDEDEWKVVLLIYEKANSADLCTIWALHGAVEVVGVYGEEDIIVDETAAAGEGGTIEGRKFVRHPHNAPYPDCPWVRSAVPPLAPLYIVGGTYTGDDIGQDIIAKLQLTFLFVRPLTSDQGGVKWWTSMIGSHRSYGYAIRPQGVAQAFNEDLTPAAEDDPEKQMKWRVAGNQAQSNASAVVYQYIGVGDPWMRNYIAGAFNHKSGAGLSDNPLPYPKFTPNAVWLMEEDLGTSITVGLWYKGPGHAADGAQKVSTSESAGALSLEEGNLVSGDPLHTNGVSSVAFLAVRRNDGSGDPGAGRVVQIGSYTGNGSATRTLALAPASGRWPLFAFAGAVNAAGYVRDPSHTGSTSSPIGGGSTVTTAIIAGGVDEITVGTSLNANGVVYNYFVIPGSEDDWENGEWWPVDPGTLPPDGGPFPGEPPEEPTFPPEPGPGGGGGPTVPPGLPVELGECEPDTRQIANAALSRVGVSRIISDLETDETQDAYQVRLHYIDAMLTTLRDFPWPFATKYATLSLVAGSEASPVNGDWTYSYRQPDDCIFERRIVVVRDGAVDPTPPPFQLSTDAAYDEETETHSGGRLILTNQANAVLEYTAYVPCVALHGDALFREALMWRLAQIIAAPLSRLQDREVFCEQQYRAVIQKAWDVMKPGVPGPRPAAATIDIVTGAPEANVSVVNRGLLRIGARTIANLFEEQSREAQAAALIFEEELRATLRDFPWSFATQYASLAWVDGATDEPLNKDWVYSYRLPDDVVMVRRVVTERGRSYDPNPYTFRVGKDATGGLIFLNREGSWLGEDDTDGTGDEPDTRPVIEYTARVEAVVLKSDALFRDAFAWRLAAALAPTLAQVDLKQWEQRGRSPEAPGTRDPIDRLIALRKAVAREAWGMYQIVLNKARVAESNAQQRPPEGQADWITGRE